MKDEESKSEQTHGNSTETSLTNRPPNDIFNSTLGIFSVPSLGGIFGGQAADNLQISAKPSKPSRKKKSTRNGGEGVNSLKL